MKTGCLILAGGAGKRMKSERPKVLCEVLKKPMLGWALDAAMEFSFDEFGVVTGFGRELTEKYISDYSKAHFDVDISEYYQPEQLGTGDAVKRAEEFLRKVDMVCVLCGDAPFMNKDTLENSFGFHSNSGSSVTVISAALEDPSGYGRIIRDKADNMRFNE